MPALRVVFTEPDGDRLSRLGLRLAVASLLVPGVLALHPHLLSPSSGLTAALLPYSPHAHATGMTIGFCGLFVISLLFRIVPRGRLAPLPRPAWGATGLLAIFSACCTTYLQSASLNPVFSWATAALWAVSLVGLAGSLGACFLGKAKRGLWTDGWIGAGLTSMALVVAALAVASATGQAGIKGRAPLAFIWAGLCPIVVGLSARMLPPLSGIRSADREKVKRASSAAAGLGAALALAILLDLAWLRVLVGIPLAVTFSVVFVSIGMLRPPDRATGGPGSASAPPARLLRWSAQLAWLALAAGNVLLIMAALAQQLEPLTGLGGPSQPVGIIGAHLIGLGFIAGMALAVGQRVVPAWLAEDIRWPQLRPLGAGLWAAALVQRVAADLIRGHRELLLHSALWCLSLGVLVVALQVGRSLRSKDSLVASGCPAPPAPAE